MKKRMKPIILVLSAVLLAGVTVLGTLAFLSDTDALVNTFTVGSVNIRLNEAVVDKDGTPTGGRTDEGNEYHLLPGHTYTKDPTLTVVQGSEESYVRMLVTINCYDELTAIFGDPFLPQYFVEGWDSTVWLTTGEIVVDEAANTATYEFRYFESVKPEIDADLVLDALFDSITVPGDLTGDQLSTIADLEIAVEGHAIQKDGFDTADAAWAEFGK